LSFLKGREEPGAMSPRYRLFRSVLNAIGSLLLGFTVHGAENTPARGPLIVAANHHRYFDPVLVCMAVPRRVQWMAKRELFISPFDRVLALAGAFPVDRGKGGRSALRAAQSYLSRGWALGVFPEGTRRRDRTPGEARSGAAMLAARSGARILPVYVDRVPGLRARLRGERLHVYIGKPITPDNTLKGGKRYRRAAEEMLEEIYALPGGRR
jgi:1-acyl-sn-glycerol-3-phosphate acyltransferase